MSIPDYQTLMAPVLRQLSSGEERAARDLAAAIAVELGLTSDELAEVLPSGTTVWRSRVQWATQYLYQAGAVARARRGVFVITDRGRELLAAHPNRVTNDELMRFEEFRDFKQRARSTSSRPHLGEHPADSGSSGTATPLETIVDAAAEANEAVAADLVTRVNAQAPEFLELVVLRLLVAMGYAGGVGRADHLGRSGDEGVDGVIRQDALGLDRIYVQAKRYGSGRTVGRPEIQAFVGALHGAQASRGVFITTSRFSPEAIDYAARVAQSLVLVDGDELGHLMVEHGVGVQVDQTIVMKRVDEDFFEL